jgi:hypothetical protein
MTRNFGQGVCRHDPDTINEGCFRGVGGRNDDSGHLLCTCHRHERQDPGGVTQGAVKGELAEEHGWLSRQRHLAGGGEDADRDRHVVPRTFFAYFCRGEVYGDSLERKRKATVAHRGTDPVACLPHGGVREADDCETGEATCKIYFYFDGGAFHSGAGAGEHPSEHLVLHGTG